MKRRIEFRVAPGGIEELRTRGGYQCARCGEGMRLAPSGQRIAASGAVTWCVECIPFFGGPEA